MKIHADFLNSHLKLLWIAMGGKEDITYKNCQIMLGKFDELKIKYTYSKYPGGHIWPVWRNNQYNFVPLLFRNWFIVENHGDHSNGESIIKDKCILIDQKIQYGL